VNTHIRRRFVRQFSVILGAGLLTLLGSMAGAITISHAAAPESPPQSLSRSPSGVSKIDRALPGARKGLLIMVKGNIVQINGLNYPLAQGVLIETLPPGVLIETNSGRLLPVSTGWELQFRYPLPVQYWLGPGQTGVTQLILTLPPERSASPRKR
jgi:hypothetical protein